MKTPMKHWLPLLAVAALAAPATSSAMHFTVGTEIYDVTYSSMAYDTSPGSFTTAIMPWWGNPSLASEFATAVGASLGLPNTLFAATGPLFAYSAGFNADVGGNVALATAYSGGSVSSNVGLPGPASFNYATATDVGPAGGGGSVPVPGTLPLLAAGALAWRRRVAS